MSPDTGTQELNAATICYLSSRGFPGMTCQVSAEFPSVTTALLHFCLSSSAQMPNVV